MLSRVIKSADFLDKSQWVVVCGLFFPNRLELLTILYASLLIYSQTRVVYQSKLLKYMLVVFVTSLLTVCLVGYSYEKCFQQIFLLVLFLLSYEQFFFRQNCYLVHIFIKYVKVCYIVALLGVLQELIYMITHVNIMCFSSNYLSQEIVPGILRVTSTTYEGGYLGTVLVPCLIYLFLYNDSFDVFYGKWGKIKKLIIMVVSLLTLSPFVYITIVIICIVHVKKTLKIRRRMVPFLIGILALGGYAGLEKMEFENEAKGINGILKRVKDSYQVLRMMSPDEVYQISMLNTSTATLAANMYVGFYAPSRFLGTGLGTNSQNHDRVIGKTFDDDYSFATLNTDDGYSLFNRILSELGIVGLICYLLFIFKHFNKRNFLNICILAILTCWFIRGGSYVNYGTIFYHFFYYYTSKFDLSKKNAKVDNDYYCNI